MLVVKVTMEPNKEEWINRVLTSLDQIQPAEPSPFLYAKIRNRLTATTPTVYVPARRVWLAVASFALLVLMNWRVASRMQESTTTDNARLSTVVSEMQLYPVSNQPYDVWSRQNY